jgi:UPF0755 protein
MKKRKFKPLFLIIILVLIIGILVGSYFYFTGPVNSNDKTDIEVEIKSGTSREGIAKILKEKGLIRNTDVFKLYLKVNKITNLKAATYLFNKSMSLEEIVKELEKGSTYNPNRIVLTFREGERITDYAKVVEKNTNNSYDDFINTVNDKEYLNGLITDYWFLTNEILDSNIYYSLEGYLAPETYYFENKDVSVKDIIETMLKQEDKVLSKYKDKISSDPHYYITMASIVELEGTNSDNMKKIVSVFENRLKSGMNLGSDVTTYYGLQVAMTSDLTSNQFASVNGYNTRSTTMLGKMPVGPISNPGLEALDASINPDKTDYYYFVADKHGKVYFTKTLSEHNSKVAEIKKNGDWIW